MNKSGSGLFSPLFLNLPVFLLFVFLSRHRGFRICFTLMTHFAAIYTVPLAYYSSCYYYIMRVPPADRNKNLPFQCFFAVITIISYVVILFFFEQTRQHAQKENELQLLKVTA